MVVINVPGFVSEQPEVRYVGESPVITVKVVDKQRRRNRETGEWETEFLNFKFECWGSDALFHAEKLTKGRNVIAVGTNPKKETWTGRTGDKREGLVYELVSVGYPYQERQGQQSSESNGQAPQGRPAPSQQPSKQPRYAQNANQAQRQNAEPQPRMPNGAGGQGHSQGPAPAVNAQSASVQNRFARPRQNSVTSY